MWGHRGGTGRRETVKGCKCRSEATRACGSWGRSPGGQGGRGHCQGGHLVNKPEGNPRPYRRTIRGWPLHAASLRPARCEPSPWAPRPFAAEAGCPPEASWGTASKGGSTRGSSPPLSGWGLARTDSPSPDWLWEAVWGQVPVDWAGGVAPRGTHRPQALPIPGHARRTRGGGEPPPLLPVSVTRDVTRDGWEGRSGGAAPGGRRVWELQRPEAPELRKA